jgi:isocitrate dehydrogenase kinase/phosphatase
MTGLRTTLWDAPSIRARRIDDPVHLPQAAVVPDRLRHRAHHPGRLRPPLPLFRQASQAAKTHFEHADWRTAQQAARERIDFYDRRVQECVHALEDEYAPAELNDETWREVKLHYIGLLTHHKRPELAESFFNSVSCHILHRSYYRNDFIFVRPAVSTEYIETEEPAPTYRVYYPAADGLRVALRRIVTNFQLARPFADLERDVALVEARLDQAFGLHAREPNQQLQVLSSLFFRNKDAYIVGRAINGARSIPSSCRCCTEKTAACCSIPC